MGKLRLSVLAVFVLSAVLFAGYTVRQKLLLDTTPPVITCFFGGGPAGVFGNSTGGWRGAILAGVVAGLMISFGQMLTVGCLSGTIADFARWSNDFDYSVFPFFFQKIAQLFC